jgi:lycopene cyclase domain-containing protein
VTYFDVLGLFVIPPLLILLVVVPRDGWRWIFTRNRRVNWEPYLVILLHVIIALVYTTLWDNYLVAKGVWWYDPALVTGMTLGWVPIEEYTFFIAQTLLTGLWTLALVRGVNRRRSTPTPAADTGRRPGHGGSHPKPGRMRSVLRPRPVFVSVLVVSWAISTLLLVLGDRSGTYLRLILSWALIPVLLQAAFGADILLAKWRLLLAAILPPTLYLWLVDAIAIASGTWTIDPAQTTGVKVGPLPLEEMVFFLMTNLIVAFGVTLMLSPASKSRARALLARLKASTRAENRPISHTELEL